MNEEFVKSLYKSIIEENIELYKGLFEIKDIGCFMLNLTKKTFSKFQIRLSIGTEKEVISNDC